MTDRTTADRQSSSEINMRSPLPEPRLTKIFRLEANLGEASTREMWRRGDGGLSH